MSSGSGRPFVGKKEVSNNVHSSGKFKFSSAPSLNIREVLLTRVHYLLASLLKLSGSASMSTVCRRLKRF